MELKLLAGKMDHGLFGAVETMRGKVIKHLFLKEDRMILGLTLEREEQERVADFLVSVPDEPAVGLTD